MAVSEYCNGGSSLRTRSFLAERLLHTSPGWGDDRGPAQGLPLGSGDVLWMHGIAAIGPCLPQCVAQPTPLHPLAPSPPWLKVHIGLARPHRPLLNTTSNPALRILHFVPLSGWPSVTMWRGLAKAKVGASGWKGVLAGNEHGKS